MALLDDLTDELCVDERRVYSTGMSNGAIMSYRLASEESDRIAAIAPVAAAHNPSKMTSPVMATEQDGQSSAEGCHLLRTLEPDCHDADTKGN